jgi:tRNA G37 N-methylase TrmD
MRFDVLTLFPEMFQDRQAASWAGRSSDLISVHLHSIRDYARTGIRWSMTTPGGARHADDPSPFQRRLNTSSPSQSPEAAWSY